MCPRAHLRKTLVTHHNIAISTCAIKLRYTLDKKEDGLLRQFYAGSCVLKYFITGYCVLRQSNHDSYVFKGKFYEQTGPIS